MDMIDHDLLSMQEARILAENAAEAQKKLSLFSQEMLNAALEHIAAEILGHVQELAVLSAEETGYGRWEDKVLKNRFASQVVSGAVRHMKCVGILPEDTGTQIMSVGVPRGPIVALCPATSPVSTAIYMAIISIKSGNSVVFAPHPRAKKVLCRALDVMSRAAAESGLPNGALACLHMSSMAGTQELMRHPAVPLILMTGVPSMLSMAKDTGKPVLCGGDGNGPVFIERTADLEQAVRDIVRSKTFDFGAVAAEQSVVVDAPVADQVKKLFQQQGAYFMTKLEADQIAKLICFTGFTINREFVGKPAKYLAAAAGFPVPEGTALLISEQTYVSEQNPYARGAYCPLLAYYVEQNWRDACEKCIELLLGEQHTHTLTIHSRDMAVIEQFALKKPVARMLVNTPAFFGGTGVTTNFFPALSMGNLAVGAEMSADNVSPMSLVYIRKIGWGVRPPEELFEKEQT